MRICGKCDSLMSHAAFPSLTSFLLPPAKSFLKLLNKVLLVLGETPILIAHGGDVGFECDVDGLEIFPSGSKFGDKYS